jgi:glycosyltransferase involved in cell wall biosynthesis
MTHHGPDYERKKWGQLAKRVLRWGEAYAYRWADVMICVSPVVAEAARAGSRVPSVMIPNGAVLTGAPGGDEALHRFGVERGRYVLTVGRFVPEKRFHDLISAFCRLQAGSERIRGERWRLVIVGQADHRDAYSATLERLARKAGNVVLTGFLSGQPLQQLFAHAGLFVLPSSYEGLPIALLEAMSHGTACLASDIPAHEAAGLAAHRVFPVGDVPALAERIDRLTERPLDEAERDRQIEFVRERFNWDRIAEQTYQVYRSLIGEGDGTTAIIPSGTPISENTSPAERANPTGASW